MKSIKSSKQYTKGVNFRYFVTLFRPQVVNQNRFLNLFNFKRDRKIKIN